MRPDHHTATEHDASRYARAHDTHDDGPTLADCAEYDETTEAAIERCTRELGCCPECGEVRGRCLECHADHCLTLTCMPRDCRDEEMRAVMADDERKAWM